MIRVILSGASGKVGSALVPAFQADPEVDLIAAVAPSLGVSLDDAIAAGDADVIVDFSAPDFAARACDAAVAARMPLVLGTSGLLAADRARLHSAAVQAGVPIFQAANFAVGAVLMMRFAAQARELFPDCHIIELHADTKRDSPSGTALATAELLGGDVPISSVRLPGLIAHHEVVFGGPGQTLTISHDTTSRESFAPGVLVALKRVRDLPPGFTSGMDALL